MLVNKINPNLDCKPVFKSRRYETDDKGNNGIRFNCLYNTETENAYVEFYKVELDTNSRFGYKVADKNAFHGAKIEDGGVFIDFNKTGKVGEREAIAYRYKIESKNNSYAPYYISDAGINLGDNFVLMKRDGTTPVTNGAAVALMHDSNRIAHFDNNGNIIYDLAEQKVREQIEPNYSTVMGGNIAGAIKNIEYYKDMNVKVIVHTPLWGYDTRTPHGYAAENPFQISPTAGTTEQFRLYIRKLYENGMMYQHDATFTNESAFGNRFQNATKHYQEKPLDYYRFSIDGILDYPIAIGLLPEDDTNLRIKFVNSPLLLDGKPNRKYDSSKETYVQVYDTSLVSEEQKNDVENIITHYEKAQKRNELKAGTYKDIAGHEYFRCEPNMAVRIIKNAKKDKINFNTPDSVFYVMDQFPNFKLAKNSKGVVEWESMPGLISLIYDIDHQIEKNLEKLSPSERKQELKMREIAIASNLDLAMQASKYVFQYIKDSQIMESLDNLKGLSSEDEIENAIKSKLPPEAQRLSKNAIKNIVNGSYKIENPGEGSKDETIIKALMELPLEAIPFAPSTVGVLSSEYMANMATSEKDLGKSRYEFMLKGNPQLLDGWKRTYENVNKLFTNNIKSFADKVIEAIDKDSSEKLIEDGEYTEYGNYVVDLIGKEITKYAFLKSLTGKDLKPQILDAYKGSITYNYDEIREKTSLAALGISESTELKTQAEKLQNLLENGLRNLSNEDVEFLANAFKKQLDGTNTITFRLAHAIYNVAGLGGNLRLDAAKNIIDINAVKTHAQSLEDAQDRINFIWSKIKDAVKSVNPHVNIAGELTDYGALFEAAHGIGVNGYKDGYVKNSKYNDVYSLESKFEGITSTYEYYLYSALLHIFGRDVETGVMDKSVTEFMNKISEFLTIKSLDYTNNRPVFYDNHDKPSAIHALAVDTGLFFGVLDQNIRKSAIEVLMNKDTLDETLQSRISASNDFFKTVNYRAVAVSKLFRDIISNELPKDTNPELISCLKQATADLANGNYLGQGENIDLYKDANQVISPEQMRIKSEYGTQDFRSVIQKLIAQAKYIAKEKDLNIEELFKNESDLYADLFIKSTAPAVQKALEMTSVITAIPGMPMVFLRDMLCGLGFEEKTWNVYLKMRGLITWSELESENEKLRNYIKNVFKSFSDILSIRSHEKADPLNYGNPYVLNTGIPYVNGVMMHDAKGGVTVSLIDLNGVEKQNKVNYFEKLGISGKDDEKFKEGSVSIDPNNPYVPIKNRAEYDYIVLNANRLCAECLNINDRFINIGNKDDKDEYVLDYVFVKDDKGNSIKKLAIKSAKHNSGYKICLNKSTTLKGSSNRVMILAKKLAFKGHQINKQYNFVTNPYLQKETIIQGEKLGIKG